MKEARRVTRTILEAMPYIDGYCEGITKFNHTRAINSYYGTQDTLALMEKIIEKSYQVQQLHNLKIKTEKQLGTLKPQYGKALTLFFLKAQKAPAIAKEMGIAERTIFRYIEKGLEEFAENIDAVIPPLVFRQLLANNGLIRSLYMEQRDS